MVHCFYQRSGEILGAPTGRFAKFSGRLRIVERVATTEASQESSVGRVEGACEIGRPQPRGWRVRTQ